LKNELEIFNKEEEKLLTMLRSSKGSASMQTLENTHRYKYVGNINIDNNCEGGSGRGGDLMIN
jgi:hypothetical protein